MNIKFEARNYFFIFVLCILVGFMSSCSTSSDSWLGVNKADQKEGAVIEVVTFQLKEGVTFEQFQPLDKAVELQHVAKQPGFISRESAAGENGEWLVVVYWRSIEEAEASMASFSNAVAAAEFMSKIKLSTMSMKRYSK